MPDEKPQNSPTPGMKMPEQPSAIGGAPAATGMMTPQSPEGEIEAAKLDAYHAMRLLDRLIAKIGRDTEYASAALRARAILTSQFGEHEEDSSKFSDAEMKRMLLMLAGPGQPAQQPPPPQPGKQPQPGAQPGPTGE